jgi:hypothetical protein
MWPSSALRIPDAISVDDPMTLIFQEREPDARCPRSAIRRQPLEQLSRVLVRIDADREHLHLQMFTQKFLQLNELRHTVRSPMATIKDQDDRSMPPEPRQSDRTPILIFKSEIRGQLARLHPV